MRKISFLMIFCFAIVDAQHFPTGMTWEEVIVNPDMDVDNSSIYNKHLFEVGKDTLIRGITYKKIMKDNNYADLYIRESGKKVWLLSNNYPSEILLYDFDWDNGQNIITEHLKESNNGDFILIKDTMIVGDYQTVSFDNQSYQYHREHFYRSTIRDIGNVAELHRNSSLLGFKELMTPLPGLDYYKVLWIRRNGITIFQSENVSDWTVSVPTTEGNANFIVNIPHKEIQNSKLPVYYEIQGCRLTKILKCGVYIRDGTKVVVK